MIFNNNSKVIRFEYHNPTAEEYRRYHIPVDNQNIRNLVVNANGSIFYTKSLGNYRMINELIGSHLAKKLDLDTVDYEIGETTTGFQALSKPFYEEGYSYEYFKDYFQLPSYSIKVLLSALNPFVAFCITDGLDMLKDTSLYSDALKLIALDLKMAQIDRHSSNLQVKIKDNKAVSFAPIYDYSESYLIGESASFYFSPLIWIKKNRVSLNELIRRHPELWDYLEYLMNLSIYDILESIGEEKDIEFTGNEVFNYQKSQRLIERPLHKIKIKEIR